MKQISSDEQGLTVVSCPGLFAAIICLPRTQKTVSECYVIEWIMGTIVEWYEYCALLDAVGGLCMLRKSTENLL